ncbi:MAG: sodium-dependent bicarbonate transport family permease [Phycisphaerales bacterium]
MTSELLLQNLLSPPILFFFVGMAATLLKSDLEVPHPLPRLFSLYLLWAIGFKGGVELAHEGLTGQVLVTLGAAVALSFIGAVVSFYVLRWKVGVDDAAGIAACYGSISAVTFITAVNFLERSGVAYGGQMVAAMALMESPAIVAAVLLSRTGGRSPISLGKMGERVGWRARPRVQDVWGRVLGGEAAESADPAAVDAAAKPHTLGSLVREALMNGPVFLILGSLIVGAVCHQDTVGKLKPFTTDIFYGVLVLFLLDMGIVAAKRLRDLAAQGVVLVLFALLFPLVSAAAAVVTARMLHLPKGDAFLLTVLASSASYIAAPAAVRVAIPRASAGLHLPMALAVTFPFNITVGLPLYLQMVTRFVG